VSKSVNYLLVAHGAGLAGSLLLYMRHPDLAPPFDGLDQLILLFGVGVLLGALILGATMTAKNHATRAIASQGEPGSNTSSPHLERTIRWLVRLGLWASSIALTIAILLIILSFCGILVARWIPFFTQQVT
jgi:hypothetical protein